MNWALKTILYGNMQRLQAKAKQIHDKQDVDDIYHFYERKLPFYNYITNRLTDPENHRETRAFQLEQCPDHPANPNHKDYDHNKLYWT